MESDESHNCLVIDEAERSPKKMGSTTVTDNVANGTKAIVENEHANGHTKELNVPQPQQSVDSTPPTYHSDRSEESASDQPEQTLSPKAPSKSHPHCIQSRRESIVNRNEAHNNNNIDKKDHKKSAGSEKTPRNRKKHRHDKIKSGQHHDKSKKKKIKQSRTIGFGDGTTVVADRLAALNQCETKTFTLTMAKHQFYNMKLYLRDDILLSTKPDIYPAPVPLGDINFGQLLHWPGVSVCISVDHLQIRHSLKANTRRQIVFGNDPMIEIPLEENCLDTRYISLATTTRRNPLLAKQPILDFMRALLEAGPIYDMQVSRLCELKTASDVIKTDLDAVPFTEVELRSTHSRFQNKYKYVRHFAHDTEAPPHTKLATIREFIDPEVNFCIDKCIFSMDNCDLWLDQMELYLKEMFETGSKTFGDALRERFKKCITLSCQFCYQSFDGPLGSVSMIAHMKEKHYFAKNFQCTNCKQSWPFIELLTMKWKHDCHTQM